MSNYKETHYWTQLRSTLTSGQWASQFPARTPFGAPLSWSELLRKFNKHCVGFRDVSEIALYTRTLGLLLAARSEYEEDNNTKSSAKFPLSMDNECVSLAEHVEEVNAGYEALKNLESPNANSRRFALAYYAYALDKPSECLSYLAEIQDICNIRGHIPTRASTLTAPTNLSVPTHSSRASVSSAGGSSYAAMVDSSLAEINDGRSWAMTEAVRSICLQGLCHEKLSPSDPKKALLMYATALSLIKVAASEFAFTPPASPTVSAFRHAEPTPFVRFRELWIWVDRLIWRAVTICSRTSNIFDEDAAVSESDQSLWTWLQQYSACCANWPPDFCTGHRSTISVIYLRALVVKHHRSLSRSIPKTPVSLRAKKVPPWLTTARSVISSYRDILNVSTKFPRAGEHNAKVEDFVDSCMAVWEAAGAFGEHASWLIDIMWWATRLTFNSPRVLRHLTRLLFLSGDGGLGKRTLKLYAQVVGKAWQTNNSQAGEETDTNDNWVELLSFGVRMLCKQAMSTSGMEGVREAREAGELLAMARTRLDANNKRLAAYVDMTEGIWNTAMAFKEQDPFTRPQKLENAHNLFRTSVDTYPTALGYFYFALSFARGGVLQDLQQAIVYAGQAVESDSVEVRYWHLLGILLSAAEQWKAAVEILERGAALDDVENPDPVDGFFDGFQLGQSNEAGLPVRARDYDIPNVDTTASSAASTVKPDDSCLTPTETYRDEVHHVLDDHAQLLPPSSDLLGSIIEQCWPLSMEIFSHSLQLRLTQVAVTEAMEGPEGAEQKWLEVFAWISAKRVAISDNPQPSLPRSNRASLDMSSKARSGLTNTLQSSASVDGSIGSQPSGLVSDGTIPITVISPEPESQEREKGRSSTETANGTRQKRSMSIDRNDRSKSKKVQQMLKTGVHKGHERITTISKKIGHGVARSGGLRRTSSTPDLHAVLHPMSYQASSIHSRRRVSSILHSYDETPIGSPTPPTPPVPPVGQTKKDAREAKENKMLSDVWLMSAATFRRLGKIEQAKGAIQEAEVLDEGNPAVWVQLGLYYIALGQRQHALDALQKALFLSSEDVSATVHLARLYLMPEVASGGRIGSQSEPKREDVDLVAGLLSHLTRGAAWDVPEAWYFLAKAYGMQERKDRERECLAFALELSEHRGVREISAAIGCCI